VRNHAHRPMHACTRYYENLEQCQKAGEGQMERSRSALFGGD
jgi:hypothetical protein